MVMVVKKTTMSLKKLNIFYNPLSCKQNWYSFGDAFSNQFFAGTAFISFL